MTVVDRKTDKTLEVFVLLIAFLVVNVASQVFQKPISVNDGKGWDGWSYYMVAQQLSVGQRPVVGAPFVYRIGTPFLASILFRDNLILGFKIVNIVANAASIILLIVWLRIYLNSWKLRVAIGLLFLTQWHAPTRIVYFYPVSVDPWLYVFLLAGLVTIHKLAEQPDWKLILFLGVLCSVGVIFREVVLIVPVALLFASNPLSRGQETSKDGTVTQAPYKIKYGQIKFLIPLAISATAFLTVRHLSTQTNSYSFLKVAASGAYTKPMLMYLHAWFISFGPLLVIPVYHWRTVKVFLLENQFLLVYLAGAAMLGWFGGADTERLLYWSMPAVYVLVGKCLEDHPKLLNVPQMVILGLTQLISQRILWTVPDFPNPSPDPVPLLTLPSSSFQYFDLWSTYGNLKIEVISLGEYVVLISLLLWSMRYRSQRLVRAHHTG